MRKFFVNLLLIPLLILSGCSKDKSDVPPVKPTDLISETEAEFALGGTDLSLEFNGVVDLGDNTYKITYLPTPLGSDDPVIVKVIYPSDDLNEGDVKSLYNQAYSSRVNKRKIEGIGESAYVAFPSLNIYDRGHFITITAGSGDTQKQLDLLLNLGKTAVNNLDKYLSE